MVWIGDPIDVHIDLHRAISVRHSTQINFHPFTGIEVHVDSHIDPRSKNKVHISVLINVRISNPIDVHVDLHRVISAYHSMQINSHPFYIH